jgi:glyoxylase-like metal-dependent hydrolase (beta-lactamase superfamily II)
MTNIANRSTLLGGSYLFGQVVPIGLAAWVSVVPLSAQTNPYSEALLGRVRAAARAAPEARPRSLHFLTFAEAQGRRSGAVAGADTTPVVIAFPVFQIRFTDKWIMVDAGFEHALWDEFSGPDWPVTYWQDRYDRVLVALRGADRIVLTHEHWDHAAGVQRGPQVAQVAAKTLLTSVQLKTFIDPPDAKHYVRVDSASASRYRTVDYDLVYPLAPGVVLIKAPGHTPGAQLIYLQLASGRELLLVGDLVWLKEGLETGRQRPEATSKDLKEDRHAIRRQIDWVRRVVRLDKITAVPSHDSRVLKSLVQSGVLQKDVDLTRP